MRGSINGPKLRYFSETVLNLLNRWQQHAYERPCVGNGKKTIYEMYRP